jgi:hypothetical protein
MSSKVADIVCEDLDIKRLQSSQELLLEILAQLLARKGECEDDRVPEDFEELGVMPKLDRVRLSVEDNGLTSHLDSVKPCSYLGPQILYRNLGIVVEPGAIAIRNLGHFDDKMLSGDSFV